MSAGTLPVFSQVYERYHDRVVAYAAKLLGPDDAEDVAQEVFVKIGRSLESLEEPSKLASWIYAITINTVRDAARRRSIRFERRSGPDDSASGPETGEDAAARLPDQRSRNPEETAIRNEMVACYLDYVERLPGIYNEVYVFKELGNLSNEEIAQRLGISIDTVKIRLHRARARLHEELRRNCRCYHNERGELMGEPKGPP